MNRIIQVGDSENRLTINSASPEFTERAVRGTSYWKWYPTLRRLLILPPLLMLSLVIGLGLGYGVGAEALVMFLAVMIGAPILWRKPILGAYLLIAILAIVEPSNMRFPDSLTDRIPLHKPMSQLGLPLPLTAVEALMLGMIALIAVKMVGERRGGIRTGPIFVAMAVYSAFLAYGMFRGLSQGGEFSVAIWEVRTQFYPMLMYLIVFNLVKTRLQARQVMWLLIGAVAFKGLIAVFRLVVTLKFDLGQVTEVSRSNSLMAHEESLLFVAFLIFGLLLYIFKADRKQLKFIAYATFPVALALLANQRRAGILALVLSILVIFIVVYVQLPEKRRTLVYALIALFLFSVPYLVVFRNGGGGLIGEPAASVLSTIRPDPRDAESNDYRVIEGENVGLNIAANPYTGAGFGRPMQILLPLPNLTSIFPLWAYIPHNTILWVWMRLGLLGFAAFWFMVGRMLLASTIVAGTEKDPYLKAIGLLAVTIIMAWVMQGLVDMGVVDTRLNMLLGVMIGLSAAIPMLKRSESEVPEMAEEPEDPRPASRPVPARALLQMSDETDREPGAGGGPHVVAALKFRDKDPGSGTG